MYTPEHELTEARQALERAYSRLQEATDQILIDAAIYEIQAANNRVDAAVIRAKREEAKGEVDFGAAM